ncbi:MAG: NERD domain-containing protein [Bacilli bacterium]|nr:NERD domain-containing protein [Bacilli bacterium]
MSSFYETIFLKEDSSLENKLSLIKTNPRANKDDVYMLEAGIAGEKQVAYHLNKANIGMYAMRDINLICDDLKSQIDFIVVTSHHCYFIECKNYNADIIHVDELGNFEISTRYGKRYNKIGIKSPLSQVDDQLTVFKKICLNDQEKVKSLLGNMKFKDYFKTIVVFTNPENRLNLKKAPNDIKYRILKVDNLIRQIEYDDKHYTGERFNQEQMNNIATFILNNNVSVEVESIPQSYYVEPEIRQNTNYPSRVSYSNRVNNRKNTGIIAGLLSGLGEIVLIIVALSILSLMFSNNNSNKNSSLSEKYKTLNASNIEAINNLKTVYNSSKENGFDLYDHNQCKNLKEIMPDNFLCLGVPMQVNFVDDNNLSIYKTFTCYYLKYDLDNKKLIEVSSKYVGYDNQCPGQDVGFITYDPNNEYLQKIGGYEKVLEMARFAHNNSSGFDNYYDYNHIAERGGNPGLYSIYKAKVDGYFGTISNKGSVRYDNNMEDFKTMVEYYYYIMK